MPKFIVLRIDNFDEGDALRYKPLTPQVVEHDTAQDAAAAHSPKPDDLNVPARVAVIPFRNWHEFEMFQESIKGRDIFTIYPASDLSIEDASA